MIIGFIGFGKVSQNLFKLISSDEIECVTSDEERSSKTKKAIESSNIKVLPTFKEVALASDVLISANSPKTSLEVAEKYAKFTKGIYLDLNNISPETTFRINEYTDNLVDGAIIGKIDSANHIIYICGESADELLFLEKFLNVRLISKNVGDVAILKLLRSSYTKVLSALLIESYDLAEGYGLEDEFFDMLSLTEGGEFRDKSLSRINNTLNNSKRKIEEIEEIINCFSNKDLIMVKAALEKLNQF